MALKLMTLIEDGLGTKAKMIYCERQEDFKTLQEIMHRATNLWPDAPPSVKRLSDMVAHGKILQDYGPDPLDAH